MSYYLCLPLFCFFQVFITYVDLLNTPYERQQDLQATYYFLCQCTRCLDRSELELQKSMLCPNSNCGAPVPIFQTVSMFVVLKHHVKISLSYFCDLLFILFVVRKCMESCAPFVMIILSLVASMSTWILLNSPNSIFNQ